VSSGGAGIERNIEAMNKVALLIAAHCVPEVLKLTVGTFLDVHDGSYEASLYVSLHANYHHYHPGLDEITSMPNVDFTFVDEIDWNSAGLLRFSTMHAKSLLSLLQRVAMTDCTHVAIFDHDLIFYRDFVSWALRGRLDADWVCGLFDDLSHPRRIARGLPPNPLKTRTFFPKPTVWHMLISRKMLDALVKTPKTVMPEERDDLVYDTFAKAYQEAIVSDMDIRVIPCSEFAPVVKHLWSLSFNYGFVEARATRSEKEARRHHGARVQKAVAEYRRRFPDGIEHLLRRLSPCSEG